MKNILILAVMSFLIILSVPVFVDGSIIFRGPPPFTVKPPDGWVMNKNLRPSEEIDVVLYPEGASPDTAAAFIYGRAISKKKKDSLNAIISEDKRDFAKDCPGASIDDRSDLKISINNPSKSVDYICPGQTYETVSFIDASKDAAVLFALVSFTPDGHAKNLKNLEAVVNSFLWLASKVYERKED